MSEPDDVALRAQALLGRVLHGHGVALRITEVEAYGGIHDPASHAYTRTPRSEIMYGPPWRLYVYQTRHHFCANIVTGPTDMAAAVLIRAGSVVEGIELARLRRGNVRDAHLARGPGNLTQALGITLADLGTDVLAGAATGGGVRLGPEGASPLGTAEPGFEIASGPRVGVSKAADIPWRFWIAGDPTVSAYKRSPRAV
ncbi:MAG TPA: DNA-3-methyladenine glycosylase [Aeromicrobium sp.]|nr:DNA-3-methyladenine glycosylase [Aeromicrobium sp.]HKY57580.1 DNA-3-methyladenine glycosylase [Aeromicrobium sp.]